MMERVIIRGQVFFGTNIYYSQGLQFHDGEIAEIDLSGAIPVAWINGQPFFLSIKLVAA